MAGSGVTRDAAALDSFITSSADKVPGTSMQVSMTNASNRAD
jgi:cytochrome c2